MRSLIGRCTLGAVFFLAGIGVAQAAQIQIQLRGDGNPNNDYIAWAPVPATIRVSDPSGLDGDLPVVLSDAAAGTDCSTTHRGAVLFANSLTPGKTADQSTLALTLPKNGQPVAFFVAGKFGCPSTGAKDTAIVARTATGAEVGRHDIMVRIRKDASTLTSDERQIFLSALRAMYLRPSADARSYEGFVRTHRVAAIGKEQNGADRYLDQAHGGPAFLAWHRAYLLEFERELQKIDPRVALPYWRIWQPQTTMPSLPFTTDFLGKNSVNPNSQEPELTSFDGDNPLFGWTMPYGNDGNPSTQPISMSRFTVDWRHPESYSITTPDQLHALLALSSFMPFAAAAPPYSAMEYSPHNMGHNATGPWMQNCKISPSDPIFWLFHNEHDRLWAEWQYLHDRFDNTGTDRDAYYIIPQQKPGDSNYGHFDPTAPKCNIGGWNCPPFGHNLFDTMWPWDGITGYSSGDVMARRRPPTAEMGPFPKSDVAGLWPSAPAKPRPANVIDYAGVTNRRNDLGYGYDDVPFGAAQPAAVSAALVAMTAMPKSKKAGPMAALDMLEAKQDPAFLTDVRHILERRNAAQPALSQRALAALDIQMFTDSSLMEEHPKEIMAIAESALSHPDPRTRSAALHLLLDMNDKHAVHVLLAALAKPAAPGFSRAEAIRELGGVENFTYAAAIRPYLHSPDAGARLAAIEVLAGDTASLTEREAILADRKTPFELREAALDSLVLNNPALPAQAGKLAADTGEAPALRSRAIADIGAYVLQNRERVSDRDMANLRSQVAALGEAGLPRLLVENVEAAIDAASAHH
ncbi:MAG: tyrosinase family protein [Rhizomicrobium sp.]